MSAVVQVLIDEPVVLMNPTETASMRFTSTEHYTSSQQQMEYYDSVSWYLDHNCLVLSKTHLKCADLTV